MSAFALITCSRDSVKVWTYDEDGIKDAKLLKTVRAPRSVAWNHSCACMTLFLGAPLPFLTHFDRVTDQVVACGSEDGTVELVGVTNMVPLHKLTHGEVGNFRSWPLMTPAAALCRALQAVTHTCFSSSSRYLCTASKAFAKVRLCGTLRGCCPTFVRDALQVWDLKMKGAGELLRLDVGNVLVNCDACLRIDCVYGLQTATAVVGVSIDVRQAKVAVAEAAGSCRIVSLGSGASATPVVISSSHVRVGSARRSAAVCRDRLASCHPLFSTQGFVSAAFFPHESLATLLLTSSSNGAVQVWNTLDGSLHWQVPHWHSSVCVGMSSLALVSRDSGMRFFECTDPNIRRAQRWSFICCVRND